MEKNGEEGIDDDGNGYVDDIYGYNIKGKNGDVNDTDGHGTHVAGLAGQQGARIMVVKAANTSGGFSSENLVKAVNYASQNGADVINMSVGTTYCTEELRETIEEAAQRAVVVAAAGNSGKPTAESGYDDSENMFPAGLSAVLGVMSYDEAGELAWFSNWDYEADSEVDYEIIAPGENIYSTTLNGKYKMESGTSMSTAIVSAICGRVIEQWRSCGEAVEYDPELVKKCIVSGAKEVVTYTDQDGRIHQFPKVNLEGALEYYQKNVVCGGEETESTEGPQETSEVKVTTGPSGTIEPEEGEPTTGPSGTIAPEEGKATTEPTALEERKNVEEDVDDVVSLPSKGTSLRDAQGRKYVVRNSDTKKGRLTVSFAGVTDKATKKVTIPGKVTIGAVSWKVIAIADSAFYRDSSIRQVRIKDGITRIGKKAFYRCTKLQKVTIPATVKQMDESCFYGCSQLSDVTLKTKKLTSSSVGEKVFAGIALKARIKVPEGKKKSYQKIFSRKL